MRPNAGSCGCRKTTAGALAAAPSAEVKELLAVGVVCCWQMFACERVRDYDRAVQWCHRVKEFAKRWRNVTLSGVCRAQYPGVLIWRGDWAAAETELGRAATDLASTKPAMVGQALARLGDLRLRQGRREEAAERFDRSGTSAPAVAGRGAADGGRVVPQEVVPAERLGRPGHGLRDRRLVAHGEPDRERLAARRLDLGGDAVDGARELRMRLGALRGHGDARAVARRAQRDLAPDSARGSGHEERLAGQRAHGLPICVVSDAGMIPRLT